MLAKTKPKHSFSGATGFLNRDPGDEIEGSEFDRVSK
jgi:hypothetical protein